MIGTLFKVRFFFLFYTTCKVYLPLRVHVVAYILEPVLHPVVGLSHSSTGPEWPVCVYIAVYCPIPPKLVTTVLFSMSLFLFCCIHYFVVFLDSKYKMILYSTCLSFS